MGKLKSFVSETLVYGFGNVFSRIFAMFLIPLYARYLGKIDYSNLIMLQSLFTIFTFFLALNAGVFFYYYEYEKFKYKRIVFTSWFYYQIFMAALISVAMIFASKQLFQLFIVQSGNAEVLRWCLILVGFQLFPYLFNATNMNYFRIDRKPKKVVQIVLLEAIFTVTFVFISLKFLKQGLISVLTSQILARTLVSLIFLGTSKIYVKFKYFSRKLLRKILIYTWPFILSSIFTWVIISIDKFIGAQALTDKTEVALLALAMQLVLPVTVLSDMIRMAVGPYVMSIRKDQDAEKTYQDIFDLVLFASTFVLIGLVMVSPFLTLLLADSTYLNVVYVIPLMAFAKVLALAGDQFCISFSLVKKTLFILISIMLAGISGILINALFMNRFGYIVSGYSQIISYVIMATFLYFTGKKYANLSIRLKSSGLLLVATLLFFVSLHYLLPLVIVGKYLLFVTICFLFMICLCFIYFGQRNLNPFKIAVNIVNSKIRRK